MDDLFIAVLRTYLKQMVVFSTYSAAKLEKQHSTDLTIAFQLAYWNGAARAYQNTLQLLGDADDV